jgi:tRNA dimethylallyltransferase
MSCSSSEGSTIVKEDIERIFIGFAVEAQKQMSGEVYLPKKRVIVLAGPTGVGKSDFAIQLAKEIDGEIVSADSIQVYRGMDIGTAKVTIEERLEVPHHLIDIRDINEPFNVVDFAFEARQCCKKILDRDGVPIVVGGSGFYLHSLIYGPPSGPPPLPELRKKLQEELDELGSEALYERLRKLDPKYANSITKFDKQKIIRGLEIITLSGDPVSHHLWRGPQTPKTFDFRCWFLHRPRKLIYHRIDQRCDEMVGKGFLEEVKKLEAEGLRENTSAAQSIGYRQALEYLDSKQTEEDLQHFLKEFKQASRRYVKRQFTWFRKEPIFRWLDMDMHDPEVAIDIIRQDHDIV